MGTRSHVQFRADCLDEFRVTKTPTRADLWKLSWMKYRLVRGDLSRGGNLRPKWNKRPNPSERKRYEKRRDDDAVVSGMQKVFCRAISSCRKLSSRPSRPNAVTSLRLHQQHWKNPQNESCASRRSRPWWKDRRGSPTSKCLRTTPKAPEQLLPLVR